MSRVGIGLISIGSMILIVTIAPDLISSDSTSAQVRLGENKVVEEYGIIKRSVGSDFLRENKPIVYWAYLDNIKTLKDDEKILHAQPLPDSLIISAGDYFFSDKAYQLEDEGLYRFINPDSGNQQRIVYHENIDALLSALAWIYTHGNSDNSKSPVEIYEKAKHTKIFATCGGISKFIKTLLEDQGIKSRVVSTLTLEEWNTFDNGHTMIEVFREDYDKWVLYDLDNNVYFVNDEKPLSLLEFVALIKTANYEIKHLASDTTLDVSNFKNKNGYEYAFYVERLHADERYLREWYERTIQIPLIHADDDILYFFNNADRERIEDYSHRYQYMNEDQFLSQFYGNSIDTNLL